MFELSGMQHVSQTREIPVPDARMGDISKKKP